MEGGGGDQRTRKQEPAHQNARDPSKAIFPSFVDREDCFSRSNSARRVESSSDYVVAIDD
jgi:hypothetical protein